MRTVPEFPRTRPLELDDKVFFDSLFKKYPPAISEFTFTNLFAWRCAYAFRIALLGDCLFVISRKGDKEALFEPIGAPDKRKKAIAGIFDLNKDEKDAKFIRLSEEAAEPFKKDGSFLVSEDRDNFDYVYRAKDLIELKGKNFDGKRNFIKRFKEAYAFSYKRLTRENIDACLSFQEEWCLTKDCQHTEGLDREREAMQEILKNFQALKVRGAMIEINGRVEAVTLGEALDPETFVIHIEKANGAYLGIYQAITQMFCVSDAKGYAYVNREQDLGVLGLRQAKESYHPCRMVKKYTLSRKS
jgi:hypothetical protein